jgi:hypothetical protein
MGGFLQLFWVRSNDRQSTAIRRPSNRFLAPAGLDAFAHALRLAVAAKSHSYILHIERETEHAAPSALASFRRLGRISAFHPWLKFKLGHYPMNFIACFFPKLFID